MFPGTSWGFGGGRMWRQYSRHACRKYFPSSASRGILWGDTPSALPRPSKGGLWVFPYLHVWCDLCRFRGPHTHVCGWSTCSQGRRAHHISRCDVMWWGLPSCSQGRSRFQMPGHIRCNVPVTQEYWCRSEGRGDPSTPAPLTLYHWRWKVTLTYTPPSSWSVPSGGNPLCTRRPGPLPIRSLQHQHAAGGSHPCPLPSIGHDTLAKNQPSRGALRRGVLWWHRTPSSWLRRSE